MDEQEKRECTATNNPFCELPPDVDEFEPTLDEALFEYFNPDCGEDRWDDGEAHDRYMEDYSQPIPMEEWPNAGLAECPESGGRGMPRYTMICDDCGRLYFGVKDHFNCPFCGCNRKCTEKPNMRAVLFGAWGSSDKSRDE